MLSLIKSLAHTNQHENFVLAIVIGSKGSTYRKVGAMMLIEQDLNYWGLLSGGCLESDILEHCKQIFVENRDKTIHYNMRDEADMLWGMGLGCDGEVTILLKFLPSSQKHFDFFSRLKQVSAGANCVMSLQPDQHYKMTFSFQGKTHQPQSSMISIALNAPHHLLICGGSPDVPPVVAIANQVGWKTTVIDHRASYARQDKFPLANHLIHLKRSEWKSFPLEGFDSAVIMSHQFERDVQYLKKLLVSAVSYIGLLGPTKRRDKLLQDCDTQFSEHEGRVFAPIGLDIGANSPETIALAIVSEIQAVSNNKAKSKKIAFCYQDKTR